MAKVGEQVLCTIESIKEALPKLSIIDSIADFILVLFEIVRVGFEYHLFLMFIDDMCVRMEAGTVRALMA